MKKLIIVVLLGIVSLNVSANTTQFVGSLYMLDPNGNPAFTNSQCPDCNSTIGEIDKNLTTLVDFNTNTADDIIGNHALLDIGLNWSMTNLSFLVNLDGTIGVSGDFLWTNYTGLTVSTYTQLSQPLGANGEFVALDGDMDSVIGDTLIDGPFQGNTIYLEGTLSAVPIPSAAWLFGSGLLGLVSMARRKASNNISSQLQ